MGITSSSVIKALCRYSTLAFSVDMWFKALCGVDKNNAFRPIPAGETTFGQTRAVVVAGTPAKLSETSLLVRRAVIQARKNTTTANTGVVWIQTVSTASTTGHVLVAGGEFILEAPPGLQVDLSTIYLDGATSDDAVTITYTL